MARILAPSRLHLGLFDLAGVSGRKNGGVGLSIKHPSASVVATKAATLSVSGGREVPEELIVAVRDAMRRLRGVIPACPAFSIDVLASATTHIGLGSKTSTVLCALMAANIEAKLGLGRRDLVDLSLRGGTSGVGIESFFEGGMVVDAGIKDDGSGVYTPSSASVTRGRSTTLIRMPIPDSWRVTLVSSPGVRWAAGDELDFFKANTPIDDDEARRAIVAGSFALPAAVAEADLGQFIEALDDLQRTGFKAREIGGQPPEVAGLLELLREVPGVAAGMSSMGPLLFVVWDEKNEAAIRSIGALVDKASAEVLLTTSFDNAGWSAA